MSDHDPTRHSQSGSFDEFRTYLYLLARAHLRADMKPSLDASDVVQQTLLDAFRQRDQLRGDSDVQKKAWLRQILLRNLTDAIRYHRRAKRDVTRQQSLEADVDGSFRRAEAWLAASQLTPSEIVRNQEAFTRLADAITRLPDLQREAVILRHMQGLPISEVARQLDRTESAAAGLIYRALQKLEQLLHGEA